MSSDVIICNAVKRYGDFKAVDNVSLAIKKGELFTLLGPSGCGKTTLLRMIAGFNSIDEGLIKFDATVINDIPAFKRNIGMVFQNYAIFPHMSIAENVAYGLKARRFKKAEINQKVEEALSLVHMEDLKDRQPNQLSGGQQQRVALARAVVIHPGVLLMDEPLSNLDAKLRIQMRSMIKKLQRSLGITTIYVTHDQEEALAISDSIAVMRNGRIEQIGHPKEIYKNPASKFVAGFIGTSNFIEAKVIRLNSDLSAELQVFNKKITVQLPGDLHSETVTISVRPEAIKLSEPKDGILQGEIVLSTFLGDFINYEIKLENRQIIEVNEYIADTDLIRQNGEKVAVNLEQSKLNIFAGTAEKEERE